VSVGDAEVARVEPDRPLGAPAPGQAAVFYDGDLVLGGGRVTRN
jgi:tRNA U34 2-thiouridine synthase MnmA/TrmU